MKKLILLVGILAIGLMHPKLTPPATAYTIDGSLLDWGVTLSVNGNGEFNNSWNPSSPTANYTAQNYKGFNPYPTNAAPELTDAEAMYFDDDGYNLYFAVVTSFPDVGIDWYYDPAWGGRKDWWHYDPGDIALDLNGDKTYEYGIETTGKYTNKTLPVLTGTYVPGALVLNPGWQSPTAFANSYPFGMLEGSGTQIGMGELKYVDIGLAEGSIGNYEKSPYISPTSETYRKKTYVIEGSIPRTLLGETFNNSYLGREIYLHWTMECGNDFINLKGTINNPLVPEPNTLLLLGSGLVGLAGFGIKRLRKL